MMTNLFSSFDPSSSTPLLYNWLGLFVLMMLITRMSWLIPNRLNYLFVMITNTLHKEFKTLLGSSAHLGSTLFFLSLFILIVFNNFFGLFPYIFTSTSHLVMTLSLAAPIWLSFMLFGWVKNTNHMFAHLVPQSTPGVLMPFMVLIESISNMIRPGTLAVRLTANMIAGHLLMTLLGNQTASVPAILIGILLFVQVLLLLLESAVSIIQAYVFSVLATLYSSEITTH
uniref:ATP synthase subunit a n=1 Tax=Gomphiocephalus hodgsoni TaxID=221270 RepID=Q85QR0_GOMHO|nr:ATP synthase F0 subunit 6 [Gomphiocephalus hodgsoni]AAO43662.1 ATPase 6 [Gomphiocephalus hodgsoni]